MPWTYGQKTWYWVINGKDVRATNAEIRWDPKQLKEQAWGTSLDTAGTINYNSGLMWDSRPQYSCYPLCLVP